MWARAFKKRRNQMNVKTGRTKMDSPGNLKLHSFDLADQDREALTRIREGLGLTSNALAVRLAIRDLARRLSRSENATSGTELVIHKNTASN
jgi:hypothetical protein